MRGFHFSRNLSICFDFSAPVKFPQNFIMFNGTAQFCVSFGHHCLHDRKICLFMEFPMALLQNQSVFAQKQGHDNGNAG